MNKPVAAERAVVIEREIPQAPEKVWRALTQGPLIAEWLMANDFQPVVGHKFQFRMPPMPNWNGVIDCQVRVVEPMARLSYSWMAFGQETVVMWTLTPMKAGVLVRMEQSGFRPENDRAYQGATYGWQKFIAGLERVVGALV